MYQAAVVCCCRGVCVAGIIGFASETNAVNPTYAPTVFSDIVAAYPSVANIIGLCLSAANGGSMVFGGVDNTKFSGALTWLPMVQNRWYYCTTLSTLSVLMLQQQ